MMAVERCVGCVNLHWIEGPIKRMKIDALAHFVVHSCNCGKFFSLVCMLQKHRGRCGLFTDFIDKPTTYFCCLRLSPRWIAEVSEVQ